MPPTTSPTWSAMRDGDLVGERAELADVRLEVVQLDAAGPLVEWFASCRAAEAYGTITITPHPGISADNLLSAAHVRAKACAEAVGRVFLTLGLMP